MAYCIEIKKISETDTEVTYRFYSDGNYGEYLLDKNSFEATIIKPMEADKNGHILQRAVVKVIKIVKSGEGYPDSTMWAS